MSDAAKGSGTAAQPAKEEISTGMACTACLLVLAMIGVVVFVVVANMGAGGETLARVPVTESRTSQTFELDEAARVSMWTDLAVTHRDISYQSPSDELPHVIDYGIVVDRGGEPIAELRCNPFDSSFAKTSWRGSTDGVSGRTYDGRLDGCAIDLPAGSYSVTAWREEVAEDPRIRFQRTDLLLRAE